MRQAVILAGGKGTRLQERLGGLPKPLIDIGGVPLLERQILLLKRYDFDRLIILVSHAAESIIEFCAKHQNWGLDLQCIKDETPCGTAGATLAVLDSLAEEFLVVYGDTMLEVDLDRFYAFHSKDRSAGATLFLHPNDHPQDSDLVDMSDDGVIQGFHPYPHDPDRYYRNLVNAALYWVRKRALQPWAGAGGMLDFGKQLFPAMLKEDLRLRGYVSPEYIKDAGTPDRLDRVTADLESGKIERSALSHSQSVVFIDRDGTLNKEVDHLNHPEQLQLLPGVGEAIRRLNLSEHRCCVVTNQPVIARGECSFAGLRAIHNKLDTLLGQQGAYLDRLYYCPHHPDKGFDGERPELKVVCDCRKPATGMIDAADKDLNVRRDRSWLIGDSTVDIAAARNAGLMSIMVETGYAGLDGRHAVLPDFCFPDLLQSVTFILDVFPDLFEYADDLTASLEPGSLLALGGQSRSGKSHLASAIRLALRARGVKTIVLSLDRWLLSETDRGDGVLGRYDLDAVGVLLGRLSERKEPITVRVPHYNKVSREQLRDAESLRIEPTDVVLIEGTVALALLQNGFPNVARYHLPVAEAVRKRRLIREYSLRGYTEEQAIDIYDQRMLDEYPVIEELAAYAQLLPPVPTLE